MAKKAIVVLSGGQDSTTCLFWALQQGYEVHCLTIDYGQRHQAEIGAAFEVRRLAGVPEDRHELLTLDDHRLTNQILKSTSPLVSTAPLEQYKDHQSLPGGIEKTFIPMRNQLFLTIAANRAIALGADAIITGVCEEDYGGYPDCRMVFIEALEDAINIGTFGEDERFAVAGGEIHNRLRILTPLMHLTKAESVGMAVALPGCYAALAFSHTAYDGQYPPVGHDHATLLRTKGFEEANVPDPLVLRAHTNGLMDLPKTPNYAENNLPHFLKLGRFI